MVLPTNLTPVGTFPDNQQWSFLHICYVHQTLEGWIDNNPLECMVMINPHNASSKSIILHKSLLGSYFGRVPYSSSLYLSRFVQPQSRRNRYMFVHTARIKIIATKKVKRLKPINKIKAIILLMAYTVLEWNYVINSHHRMKSFLTRAWL